MSEPPFTPAPPGAVLLRARGVAHTLGGRPWLMGIVNATPDSFSDAGLHPTLAARVALAGELLTPGRGVIDIGGESGVTNRPPVEAAGGDRARRAADRARSPRARARWSPSTPTSRAVAEAAIAAGAVIVNDVSGLRDPELADVCAATGAALVVMHTRAAPKQRLQDPGRYATCSPRCSASSTSGSSSPARAASTRAADRRSRARLRQDAGADDRAAARRRQAARVRAPDASMAHLAQGFRRRADRTPAARARRRDARRARPTAWTSARRSSASTTSPPRRTS